MITGAALLFWTIELSVSSSSASLQCMNRIWLQLCQRHHHHHCCCCVNSLCSKLGLCELPNVHFYIQLYIYTHTHQHQALLILSAVTCSCRSRAISSFCLCSSSRLCSASMCARRASFSLVTRSYSCHSRARRSVASSKASTTMEEVLPSECSDR